MLKINKKSTIIIHDINLSKKIIKEINRFFNDEIENGNKYININNIKQSCYAGDCSQVNSLNTIIEWLEDGKWNSYYVSSKQYLIRRLNEVVEFCEGRGIGYVWTAEWKF